MTIKKTTNKTTQSKGELEKDIGVAVGTVQTGAKVAFNKLSDSYTNLKSEYKREELKQK